MGQTAQRVSVPSRHRPGRQRPCCGQVAQPQRHAVPFTGGALADNFHTTCKGSENDALTSSVTPFVMMHHRRASPSQTRAPCVQPRPTTSRSAPAAHRGAARRVRRGQTRGAAKRVSKGTERGEQGEVSRGSTRAAARGLKQGGIKGVAAGTASDACACWEEAAPPCVGAVEARAARQCCVRPVAY